MPDARLDTEPRQGHSRYTKPVAVRFPREQAAEIWELAEAVGITPSELVRQAVAEKLEQMRKKAG